MSRRTTLLGACLALPLMALAGTAGAVSPVASVPALVLPQLPPVEVSLPQLQLPG